VVVLDRASSHHLQSTNAKQNDLLGLNQDKPLNIPLPVKGSFKGFPIAHNYTAYFLIKMLKKERNQWLFGGIKKRKNAVCIERRID